jgi:hypothetical protein
MKESKKGKFSSKANNILSPNKVTGLADFLDEPESKSVNEPIRSDVKTDIRIGVQTDNHRDGKTDIQSSDALGIVRENFRLAEPLAERLRQYAFDKRTTKTDVVSQALEEFFTRNGY